jgi:hypothetical protein
VLELHYHRGHVLGNTWSCLIPFRSSTHTAVKSSLCSTHMPFSLTMINNIPNIYQPGK